MDLADDRLDALTRRQRRLAGPSGCGLCGLDSLAAAIRPAPSVPAGRAFTPAMIQDAMRSMPPAQTLNPPPMRSMPPHSGRPSRVWSRCGRMSAGTTRWTNSSGALALGPAISAADGLLLLSSRVSVEMVQKAATLGAPVIVAISAPTSLAIDVASRAGITLIGVARADGFEVFTHLDRITTRMARHVA